MPLLKRLETFRERLMIFFQSISKEGILIPNFLECLTKSKTCAFVRSAFVGMHPQFKQTPPKCESSTIATLFPS